MRAKAFLGITGFLVLLLVCLVLAGGARNSARKPACDKNLALARALQLTDLALWTEARYTRHPSQADSFTPFQTGPAALEHFPAGSWVPPPPRFEPVLPESPVVRQGVEQP